MNATSLYVSTCRLVIQANSEDLEDTSSWNDLYRLLPYLRNSLSCTVCDSLLVEPYSPDSTCQHHVCKACRGGKKKLKPSCSWCKSYETYVENVQLRILLQCYKKLNEYLASTLIYRKLMLIASNGGTNGLLEIIQEGAGFKDEYISSAGLSKTALKQLPCLLTPNLISQSSVNVQTQTATNNAAVAAVHVEKKPNPVAIQSSNGPSTTSHPPMLPHISHPIPIAPKIEQTRYNFYQLLFFITYTNVCLISCFFFKFLCDGHQCIASCEETQGIRSFFLLSNCLHIYKIPFLGETSQAET